jgi:spore maturation protein CgeB
VTHVEHVPPAQHRAFYTSQRFTLNLTRASMVGAGYSPSVRLFEAAACGTPIISDRWKGLDTFFEPGREILLAATADDVLRHLERVSEAERAQIAARALARVLSHHTSRQRAAELRRYVQEVLAGNQRAEKVQEP